MLKLKAAGRSPLIVFALLCAFLSVAREGSAQGSGLEEKMKYERSMEQKVEEVLANLLGPGKSKVMIRATVDFSTKESVKMEGGEKDTAVFGWDARGGGGREVLPGFSDDSKPAAGPGNYQREVNIMQARVKRLTVSLVISDTLSEEQAKKVEKVVKDLLIIDPARGDELLVMKASFAPIWYTFEMMGTILKYGMIALIAIVGMGIVAVGFLKMASAMNSTSGADQGTNIRMEMGGLPSGGEGLDGMGLSDPLASLAPPREKKALPAPETGGDVVFDIKQDKLDILVRILSSDAPEDIALVAVHLPPSLRAPFLSMLPPELAPEVVASIASVRFVDPEMIARVKEELERRLGGAVGGYGKVVEMVESAGIRERTELVRGLETRHPELAAAVRARVLLLDDLELLSEKDFSMLATSVNAETWAAAYPALSEGARGKLKAQLPEKAWQRMQNLMAYESQMQEKSDAAAEQVLAAAVRLMAAGRIKRPAGKKIIPSPLAAAPVESPKQPENSNSSTIGDYGG